MRIVCKVLWVLFGTASVWFIDLSVGAISNVKLIDNKSFF